LENVEPLLVVLLVAASALCGVAVWAIVELGRTARSARRLSDDTHERLIPLLDKADVTVDAVNAELLRIDAIITQFEDAGARVSHASDTISEIVNTPAEIVNDVAGRVRRAWKDRRRPSEESADSEMGETESQVATAQESADDESDSGAAALESPA